MSKKFTPEQKAVAEPIINQIKELERILTERRGQVISMAAMLDPRILDPGSGVSLDLNTMEITAPEDQEEEDKPAPKKRAAPNRAARRAKKRS